MTAIYCVANWSPDEISPTQFANRLMANWMTAPAPAAPKTSHVAFTRRRRATSEATTMTIVGKSIMADDLS
jgi:hypothetical protein